EDMARVVDEEAWTLGVTAPRLRSADRKSVASRSSPPHRRETAGPAPAAPSAGYAYLRDSAAIYRRSFALLRAEARLALFPRTLRPPAERPAHAAGDPAILADLAWSRGAAAAGRKALAGGATILVDSAMTAAGITAAGVAGRYRVLCTLRDPETP